MRPEDKSPDLPQSYDELRLLYLEVYNETCNSANFWRSITYYIKMK